MNRRIYLSLYVVILLGILGCGAKVLVPPEVELKEYGTVGLIDFNCDVDESLGKFMTQRFLEEISTSQKEARIVELGSEFAVLESINRDKMDPQAIQEIGQKYNLNAIITGNLDISDVKPKVSISSIITSMSVRAEVEASLSAKLQETRSSATVWTDSSREKAEVAHVSIFSDKQIHFDASDPKEAYGDLAEALINDVTRDLKVRYKRM